jgi:hypothetical protein
MPRVVAQERWSIPTGKHEAEQAVVAFCQERGLEVAPTGPDTLQADWGNKVLRFLGGVGTLPGRLQVSISGDGSRVDVLARCEDNYGPQVLWPYQKRQYRDQFETVLAGLKGSLDFANGDLAPPAPPPPPPPPAASFCPKCGYGAAEGDAFCRACGTDLAA